MAEYNIYCDESCHLENDRQNVMVLGAVTCPANKTQNVFKQIRSLKTLHGINEAFEIKWTKVSEGKYKFYRDIVEYFFDEDILSFRGLVVPDKSVLKHENYNQTHDDWYYKMYFNMLKVIISPNNGFNIYMDLKDTQGSTKIRKLHDVLSNEKYDHQLKKMLKKYEKYKG